jgi:cysteine desulfurase
MVAYLDHAATTPMRPEAVAAMLPYLTERFGNPSGEHAVARAARRAVDDARDTVAACLGCDPSEVVFTGGGTESDNLAVLGGHASRGGAVVCSAVEHRAVLATCRSLGGTTAPVDRGGVVDLDALAAMVEPGVGVVSVMSANNEVGTVEPVAEVAALVRQQAPDALVHTDAIAAVPWLEVGKVTGEVDLLSLSAHKFGGPKGVGVLVVREGARLGPVLYGGAQERGRRPGTHDVAGIVGTAAALRAATTGRQEEVARVRRMRDRLADGLLAVEGVTETAPPADGREKSVASLHLLVAGVDREELLLVLDNDGVCASAGSACASGALEPSHVLRAMGVSEKEARTAVRFSLGHSTSEAEIDLALEVVPKAIGQLRR